MNPNKIDAELEAINDILNSLNKIPEDRQGPVLEFVIRRLDIALPSKVRQPASFPSVSVDREQLTTPLPKLISIRDLREEKKPAGDVQMAVLVAYYLSELALAEERRETIQISDITKYFKQAGHPIPTRPRQTLINAKNAGYLESVGAGEYKLNPVGYNLVVHQMPRRKAEITPKKKKKRVTKKKNIRRKPSKKTGSKI